MTSTTNSTTGSGQLGDSVRAEAGAVQETTADATREVAGTAKEQAGVVAADVRDETRRLIGETRDQVTQQAGQQRDNVVGGLRSLGDELRSMADHGAGWGAQAARHGASWSDQAAGFLDGRELSDVFEDLRMMARRRPGRFLAGAVVAGILAGRASRALAAGAPTQSGSASSNGATHARPAHARPYPGDVPGSYPATDPVGSDPYAAGPAPVGTSPEGPIGDLPAGGVPGRSDGLSTAGTAMPPPTPTPSAPDLDPGAPVEPEFGPRTER